MISYNILDEFSKDFSDEELKTIINNKLYNIIAALEMNKQ